jgi:FRG domain
MRSQLVERELDNWSDFVAEFAFDDAANWIFRGQADYIWGLGTSLLRAFNRAGISDSTHRVHVENSAIGFFKDRSRLHLPSTPADNDLLGWLALMQHYGAPTRLQDWTLSPFVAAYFAYREDRECDSALWAIHAYYCRRAAVPGAISLPWDHLGAFEEDYEDPTTGKTVTVVRSVHETQAEHENEILREAVRRGSGWPLPMLPFNVDARMTAQQSAFLVATKTDFLVDGLRSENKWPEQAKAHPFAEDLAKRVAITPLKAPYQLIKRVKLPYVWRNQALRTLRRMGITEDTMFPGIDGAGRATADNLLAGDVFLRDFLNTTA